MTKGPFGFGIVAIAATASLATAGGDDEKKANSSGAAQPASAQGGTGDPTSITLKAAAGKGITIDAGDAFMMNIKNRIQPRYTFAAIEDNMSAIAGPGTDQDISTFTIQRARTRFAGHIWHKDITYVLQNDWTEGTSIKDAFIHWFFTNKDDNKIGLRFGQTKTFFGRESTGSAFGLEFVDRSLATRMFANRRQRGAMVTGEHSEAKFHWTAGAFNGETAGAATGIDGITEEAPNTDNEMSYIFSARLDPNGDMGDEGYTQGDLERIQELKWSVGAGLQIGNNRAVFGGGGADVDNTEININAGMKLKGWHVSGDIYLRTDDPDVPGGQESDSLGWTAGGSYTFEKQEGKDSQWAIGGRFSMVTLDDAPILLTGTPLAGTQGEVSELTVAVSNYYHEHYLKTQASWTLQKVDPDAGSDATNHIFEIQLTMTF